MGGTEGAAHFYLLKILHHHNMRTKYKLAPFFICTGKDEREMLKMIICYEYRHYDTY